MREFNDQQEQLSLQTVDLCRPTSPLQPLTDQAARVALMLCDDPTDPDMLAIEDYLEIARRH
jgi:hypothetical protein